MGVPNKPDKMNKLNREITDYWSQKPWFSYQASDNLHELSLRNSQLSPPNEPVRESLLLTRFSR